MFWQDIHSYCRHKWHKSDFILFLLSIWNSELWTEKKMVYFALSHRGSKKQPWRFRKTVLVKTFMAQCYHSRLPLIHKKTHAEELAPFLLNLTVICSRKGKRNWCLWCLCFCSFVWISSGSITEYSVPFEGDQNKSPTSLPSSSPTLTLHKARREKNTRTKL